MKVWICVAHYKDSENKSMWVLLVLFGTHVIVCLLLSLLFHLTLQRDKTFDKHRKRDRDRKVERDWDMETDIREMEKQRYRETSEGNENRYKYKNITHYKDLFR